ncbi:MAG: hypothetical protein KUG79_12520 [Pseudomonadales bacterium]|nr:hypothetical protein [Pseudomonadales bacterium]
MHRTANLIAFMAMVVCLVSGCQTNSLYFATDTSVGLMDIAGDSKVPDKVSIGFKRSELLLIPPQDITDTSNNKLQPVLGTLNADLTWFKGSNIKEVYATGDAANCAAYGLALRSLSPTDSTDSDFTNAKASLLELGFLGDKPADGTGVLDPLCPSIPNTDQSESDAWVVGKDNSLIFEARTAFSIAKLSYGETESANMSLLSYKRRVGSIIPLFDKNSTVRSVYSDFCFNSMKNGTEDKGTIIKQGYATGLAAIMVARLISDPSTTNDQLTTSVPTKAECSYD